mgnify:CR=1 FL=1
MRVLYAMQASTISICDEVVYAKVRSAALDEEPDEETPEQQAVNRQR